MNCKKGESKLKKWYNITNGCDVMGIYEIIAKNLVVI